MDHPKSKIRRFSLSASMLSMLFAGFCTTAVGQNQFDKQLIEYAQTTPNDVVTRLQGKLDAGQVHLDFDAERGYLPSLLKQLEVKPSSQVLVFSKTSFQLRRISPRRPRALYFNDEAYVGWVQGGDVLEIMATDPQWGQVFYTLLQEETERPKLLRDRGQCIVCHASSRTHHVPGGLVRSMFVSSSGQPHYGSGTFNIDHSSPFKKRWGGWYVTGTHGEMRHMGNVLATDRLNPESLDRETGANVTDLSDRLNVEPYLAPSSDIVALMVLEHQTQMQNYLARAAYETRTAVGYDTMMNAALERPKDYVSDSTQRRIKAVGDNLLNYMLFVDEFALTSPVRGSSAFAKQFQAKGRRDKKGRSLRDFDLKTRMFKYPCSYLIHSPSFDRLPPAVKNYVTQRLHDVLTGKEESKDFSHLTAGDRKAILEILTETKPRLWVQADNED